MVDFSSVSILPPKDWMAFERHARILFAYLLNDPLTKTNGRSGQRQHGVDIYGQRGGRGGYVGIQCKGKDRAFGRTVSKEELRHEATLARDCFKPPLEEFILITTAPDDTKIDEAARLLTQEWTKSDRPLRVAVWGWGTLEGYISRCPEALEAFHPDAAPLTKQLISLIEEARRDTAAIRTGLEGRSAEPIGVSGARRVKIHMPTAIDIRTLREPQFLTTEQWLSSSVALTVEPIAYELSGFGRESARIVRERVILQFDATSFGFRWFQRVDIGETEGGGWLGRIGPACPITIETSSIASHSTQFIPVSELSWRTAREFILSSSSMRIEIAAKVSGLLPGDEIEEKALFACDLDQCKSAIKDFEGKSGRPIQRATIFPKEAEEQT